MDVKELGFFFESTKYRLNILATCKSLYFINSLKKPLQRPTTSSILVLVVQVQIFHQVLFFIIPVLETKLMKINKVVKIVGVKQYASAVQ